MQWVCASIWCSSCECDGESLKINVFELAANVIYLFLGWRCNDGDDSSEEGGKMKHKENKEVLDRSMESR